MEIYDFVRAQFEKMCARGKLYRVDIDGHRLWSIYLSSFVNPAIFRDPDSNEHNCNTCHAFFAHFGNIIALDEDGEYMTLFDVCNDKEYERSFAACVNALRSKPIRCEYVETKQHLQSLAYQHSREKYWLGVPENKKVYTQEEADKFGVVTAGTLYTFRHFAVECPMSFIKDTHNSIESIEGNIMTNYSVFKRGLDEISLDTLSLAADLIRQDSILDGRSYLDKVDEMIFIKREYDNVPEEKRAVWAWRMLDLCKCPRFRNELIGTLCIDLMTKDIVVACETWNKRVDPANYMKAKAPITQKQIDEAMKFAQENGYESAFVRRHATMEDIRISDIIHANGGDGKIKAVSVFDTLKPTQSANKPVDFKNVPEMDIKDFLKDVLPTATGIELYVTSPMKRHLVAMTAPTEKDAKPIFKWGNDFSWTYKGNLAGISQIKEAVKNAGGFVDAPFRFSIMWNEDGRSIVDLDAHAKEPGGEHIYYGSHNIRNGYGATPMSGQLDIDMIRPDKTGVENIFWTDMSRVKDGDYRFWIENYDGGRNDGARAEICIGGDVYQYNVNSHIAKYKPVEIAVVTIKNGVAVNIKHNESVLINSQVKVETMWNLDTCQFHKVNLVCLSPNHWDDKTGNKHYLFMVDGCKTDEPIRGFHVENLKGDLLKHRKVMEVLANKLMIEPSEQQLAGFGYDETVRDSVIVRVDGTHKRVIKVNF